MLFILKLDYSKLRYGRLLVTNLDKVGQLTRGKLKLSSVEVNET